MRFPHGPGAGMFGGIFEDLLAGLVFLVCFVVAVGLLFVLVRFLLTATKAAELYIAKNGTAQPGASAVPTATTPTSTATATPRTRSAKSPTA